MPGTWVPGLRGTPTGRREAPPPRRPGSKLDGPRPWLGAVGTIIGPIEIQLFAMPVTPETWVDNVEIGPVEIVLDVIDGSQTGGGIVEGGGPPPPAFTVTGDIVMELTFLPFRPRYAVEITDTTDGLVEP